MSTPRLVPKHWIVVEPNRAHPERAPLTLSRPYHVRDAAETYAALARKHGHPDAYVHEVQTVAD